MLYLLFLLSGIFFLISGSELAVAGSRKISRLLHLSMSALGSTLVAVSTSLPEIAISIFSSLSEAKSAIVTGTAFSSFVFQQGFVTGIMGFLRPSRIWVKRKLRFQLYSMIILLFLSIDGKLDRFDALLMLPLVYLLRRAAGNLL